MSTKTKLEAKASIHNRFDIYVGDKQVAYAENIVLNQLYNRLCARSSYFVNIHFGTGTGTLSATRTSLFAHLGTKAAVDDAMSKVLPTSWWRRKIVLNPEEYVGAALSEVGIAYGSTSTNLVTHALIKDMNGNPITLVKTAVDVVTIYATVFVTFSTTNENLSFVGLPNNNPLVNYLVGGTAFPSIAFFTGQATTPSVIACTSPVIDDVVFTSATLSLTTDIANKKFSTNVLRIAVEQSNAHIAEIGLGKSDTRPIFRLRLPAPGIYDGLELSDVPVGSGDGSTVTFELPSNNIAPATVVVKVDGVETPVTKTAINKAINFRNRATIPTSLSVHDISADGTVIAYVPEGDSTQIRLCGVDDDVITLLQQIYVPESISSCALSADGSVLIVGLQASPYVATYKRTDGVWIKLPAPGTILQSYCSSVAVSADGLVIACCSPTPAEIKSYDWNGTEWIVRANPPSILYGMNRIALDADGNVLAVSVAYYSNKGVLVWDWDGSTYTLRVDPPSLPSGGQCYAAYLSNDGTIYACTRDGFAHVWDWHGSSWTKRAQAPGMVNASYHNAHLSSDGLIMVCGMKIYDWINNAWVLRTGGKTYNFSDTDPRIARDALNLIVSYYGVFDIANRSLKVTFASPPAAGAVITADYTVNGIHKTAQRVIDLYAEIAFGEVV